MRKIGRAIEHSGCGDDMFFLFLAKTEIDFSIKLIQVLSAAREKNIVVHALNPFGRRLLKSGYPF